MKKSYFFIVLAAVLWGIIGLFIEPLSSFGFSNLQLVGLRSFFGALFTGIYLLIFDRSLFKIRLRDVWIFLGSGVLSFAFFSYCYYVSIFYNGLAVSAILLYTAPIFVSVLSIIIFRSRFDRYKTLALILSVLGCVMVSGVFNASLKGFNALGILFGLGSGIGYALYSIFGKIATKRGYRSETVTFYTFLFSSFITMPMSISEGMPLENISFSIVTLVLSYAFLTGTLPYIFYTKGLEKVDPPTASVIATAEPMVAAVLGLSVMDEKLEIFAVSGILLILISLIICAKKS